MYIFLVDKRKGTKSMHIKIGIANNKIYIYICEFEILVVQNFCLMIQTNFKMLVFVTWRDKKVRERDF